MKIRKVRTKVRTRTPISVKFLDVAKVIDDFTSTRWFDEKTAEIGLPQSEGSVVARAVSSAEIAFHPVSADVSSPRKDGPELIQPVAVKDGPRQGDLL